MSLNTTQRPDLFAVLTVNALFGNDDSEQEIGGLALITLNNINKQLTGIVNDGESVSNLLINISIFFAKYPDLFNEFIDGVKDIDRDNTDINLISKFLADRIKSVALEHREVIEKYKNQNVESYVVTKSSHLKGLEEIESRIRKSLIIKKANIDTKEIW